MKKLIDLKIGDPIYILKISRGGVIFGFEETKCLKIIKTGDEIDIYYFDDGVDSFFSLEDKEDMSVSQSRNYFYADIDIVSEKLNEYKNELKIKQDLLNRIYEKSGIGSK